MEKLYRKEFPSYDGTLPELKGWTDSSWHNDTCPSLIRRQADEFGTVFMRIFCEYVDPRKREPEGCKRFTFDVQPTEGVGEPSLCLQGETMEELRQAAIQWHLENVGDSILEGDLTTGEILDKVAIMWGFHNAPALFKAKLKGAEVRTGGGCKAYAFEFGPENQVWISDWDGCSLPVEDGRKLVCIRSHEGEDLACIEVAAHESLAQLLAFLKEAGALV